MFKKEFTRFFVLWTIFNYSKAQNVQLPPSFKICSKSSRNLAQCVKESIEYLRPNLKTGDLGNGLKVISLEPLTVDDIHLEKGRGFYFHLNNIKGYKISNFKIDKIRVNPDTLMIDVLLKIPKVEATANYRINLALGILNVNGEGKLKGFIDEIKCRLKLETSSFYKNGIEYKRFSKVTAAVKLNNLVLKINDLFKDPALNEVGERLVNQNLPMFIPEIEKSIENSIARISYQAGNGIVENIPINQLLPVN